MVNMQTVAKTTSLTVVMQGRTFQKKYAALMRHRILAIQ
jgi:hypothetical protein